MRQIILEVFADSLDFRIELRGFRGRDLSGRVNQLAP